MVPVSEPTSALQPLAISAEELAALLGISRAHVWRLHSSGRLPRPVRFGRVVRWDRDGVQRWLAAGAPPRDRWEAMNGEALKNVS